MTSFLSPHQSFTAGDYRVCMLDIKVDVFSRCVPKLSRGVDTCLSRMLMVTALLLCLVVTSSMAAPTEAARTTVSEEDDSGAEMMPAGGGGGGGAIFKPVKDLLCKPNMKFTFFNPCESKA
jgi:hypothetical protein